MVFDASTPAYSRFDVSVRSSTINTGNSLRDGHLLKKDYLHAEQFPEIKFRSSSVIVDVTQNGFRMTGFLTIKGVTREISFPFRAEPKGAGYLFSATFRIDRRDFGVGGSSISLSDDLTISLQILGR
jgi:polyisoprenoid-binding protein YceI